MDLSYPAETETYRHTVQAFLDQNLPSDWEGYGALASTERHAWHTRWREILSANKLLAPTWPTEFGGAGLGHLEYVALAEEFAKRGVPTSGPNDAFSITMVVVSVTTSLVARSNSPSSRVTTPLPAFSPATTIGFAALRNWAPSFVEVSMPIDSIPDPSLSQPTPSSPVIGCGVARV